MNKLLDFCIALVPACITFGPIFMTIGVLAQEKMWYLAFIGALMTAVGLTVIFRLVMKQRKAIETLTTAISSAKPASKEI